MMNKILVNKNVINSDSKGIMVVDNVITFISDGDYSLEYVECDDIKIVFLVDGCNVRLQESSFDNEVIVNNRYEITNGSLIVNKFYNNKSVRENIVINLNKDGDRIDYNFSSISRLEEYYRIDIYHKSKKTVSNISNKSVALKNSILNFIVNSNVYKDSIFSKLDQNTRIVTMGDSSCKICPNMFIDLDEVEARHGSVIGTFKDDQLFYLMSKGISYNDAIKLLIKGFILGNIVVNLDLRALINNVIEMYWR